MDSKRDVNSKILFFFKKISHERVLPLRIWITYGLEFEKGLEFENIDFFKKLSHERVLPSRIWITYGLG